MCWAKPSLPLKKIANGDIRFLTERDWSRECCHGNNIVGVNLFLLWSLKNTTPILLEVFLIECCTVFVNHLWRHHFPHLHNTKTSISLKRKKMFPKENRHSSLLWKAFQISNYYFLLHRHIRDKLDISEIIDIFTSEVLYVIDRLGCPYSEKLWPRSWKCCPRPQAKGSIFKPEVTVFHYTDRPKLANNLFIFSCNKIVPFHLILLAKFGLCSNCSQKLDVCSLVRTCKSFARASMLGFSLKFPVV